MNARNLFLMVMAAGSAALGAGIAVTAHLQSNYAQFSPPHSTVAALPSPVAPAPLAPIALPSMTPAAPAPVAAPVIPAPVIPAPVIPAPVVSTPQMPPVTVAIQAPPEPVLFPPPGSTPALEANERGELDQLRLQLRRAIRDRDAVLLRSLMQASSLRQALSNIAAAEQVNFENLDASAWTILEKAIDYRCHQRMVQVGKDGSGCFD